MARRRKAEPEAGQLTLDISGSNQGVVTAGALQRIVADIDREALEGELQNTLGTGLMDPKKQVVMSNSFVVGLEDGSRFAHKISRIAIAQIPMDAKELPSTTITSADIVAMGLTKQRLTGHINDVIDEILSYRIKLASIDALQNRRLTGINMFAQATANPGQGSITVKLNPILREHFLELKQDYTHYALPVVPKMHGYAASKLHELLLSRSRKYGTELLRFRISDLTIILNYKPRGTYKPSTFVNNVIKRAVRNINDCTESYVRYLPLKTGREYTDIRFYVDSHWRTVDEKMAQEQWETERREDPVVRAAFEAADREIEARLLSGEGEVYLDAKDNYDTGRNAKTPGW